MAKGYDAGRVDELASQVMLHKKLYYAGAPKISDADYDGIEEELKRLAPDHPALAYVGSEPEVTSEKVEHAVPMLSLAKTYDKTELETWMKERPLVGMLKIDGNSLSLIYKAGRLTLAKTRGNGRIGERVTEKVEWVAQIPPKLSVDFDVEIRGELFCSESQFLKLVDEIVALGLDKPTSARNIVAGLLGRKKHYHLARYFSFFAFDVIAGDGDLRFDSEWTKFKWLEKHGFLLPDPKLLKKFSEVEAYLEHVQSVIEADEIGIDGAVFSYDELALHDELGATAHHPRAKMSFKWQGATATSVIERLHWATSRGGIVTPVAVIEPVFLSGATITNVTLHNAAHVKSFNLKPGDEIEIVRSGEVIPKFLQVTKEAKGQYQWPTRCQQCGTDLIFDDVRLRCPNKSSCPAQQSGSILNWIRSVEIDDLSDKRLSQMIDSGLVKSIPDLYRLTLEQMLTLPLTKEKMAQKILNNIEKSKGVELARFLTGLGIEGAGLTSWERLLEAFPGLMELQKASADEIAAVDGFAEKSATQIFLGLKERRKLIEEILSLGVRPVFVARTGGGALAGKQIAITGSLSRPRAEIQKLIKGAGGKPVSSVSKNTYAVVTGDPSSTSSKMVKARELGLPIWSEDDLSQFVG